MAKESQEVSVDRLNEESEAERGEVCSGSEPDGAAPRDGAGDGRGADGDAEGAPLGLFGAPVEAGDRDDEGGGEDTGFDDDEGRREDAVPVEDEGTGVHGGEPATADEGGEPSGSWEAPRQRGARSGAEAGSGAARAESPLVSGEPSADVAFGTWLRRQREMREIDLREIAERTKISLRYLKAMEQDRFDVLPAPVFAKGFLREYAKYVGLDPDEAVNFYLAARQGEDDGEDAPEVEVAPVRSRELASRSRTAVVVLLVVLAFAAALYLVVYQRSRDDGARGEPPPIAAPVTSTPAAGEAAGTPPAPDPAEAEPAAPLVVTLDFTERCWVEAEVDGRQEVSRLFVAGESLQLDGERVVELSNLGNPSGVEVQVNGEPYRIEGVRPGRSIRDVVIEAEGAADGAGPRPEPVGTAGTADPAGATATPPGD